MKTEETLTAIKAAFASTFDEIAGDFRGNLRAALIALEQDAAEVLSLPTVERQRAYLRELAMQGKLYVELSRLQASKNIVDALSAAAITAIRVAVELV